MKRSVPHARIVVRHCHPLALVVLTACAVQTVDEPNARTFDALFEWVSTVELEEEPGDPIVDIELVARRPDGGFVVADERAGRIRLFGRDGRLERTLGRPGDGPGELASPTAAVGLPQGGIMVVQRADPRLTIFTAGAAPTVGTLPGQYGFWAAPIGADVVVGVGSRAERFALLTARGQTLTTFGAVDQSVNETPFWIFFARDHAAVIGDEIAVNTSLFPTVRIFSSSGDSLRAFGDAPPGWESATPPPVDRISDPASRERLAEWSRTVTVVRGLATVDDSLLVVQYGRHAPVEGDPYRVQPQWIGVYRGSGEKLGEDLDLPLPVVGGGKHLLVLSGEPPTPWTIALYEWR